MIRKALLAGMLCLFSLFSYSQTINERIANAERDMDENLLEKAKEKFQLIIKNNSKELTSLELANLHNNIGYLDLRLKEPERAQKNLKKALSYHKKSEYSDYKSYSNTLFNMADLLLEEGDLNESQSFIIKAIDVLKINKASRIDQTLAQVKLAILYEEAGFFDDAMAIYRESYEVIYITGDTSSPEFAEICTHIGRVLLQTGSPKEAEEYISQGFSIYEKLGPSYIVQRAESLENLGVFYERLGRFGEAEETLLKALELKRSIPDEAEVLILESLNDLGVLYYNFSNYFKAKKMFEEVIEKSLLTVGKEHQYYATALNNLATISIYLREFEKARSYLNESLEVYEKKYGQDHPLYSNSLNNLARVERAEGNIAKAEAYYKKVLEIDERIYGKNHPDFATTLMNLAVLYSSIGRNKEAGEKYKEALVIRESVLGKDHPDYGIALERLGLFELTSNNKEKAEAYFREALNIQVNQIKSTFPVMTEIEREEFYRGIKEDINRYNYIALDLLDTKPDLIKTIFDFQIKTKAILFNTSNKVRNKVLASHDKNLINLYDEWQSEKKLLANYYQMGAQHMQEIGVEVGQIESKVETLEKSLVRSIEGFRNIIPQENENWQSVKASLKDSEVLIDLIRINEFKSEKRAEATVFGFTDFTQYLAIIFTPDQIEPNYEILGGNYRTDEAHYSQYKNAMLYGIEQTDTYELFWQPLEKHIGKAKKVIVSPDGIFYKMNLNAVRKNNNEFLIDKYFISYITSCKDIFIKEVETSSNKGYFFGNPDYGVSATFQLEKLIGTEIEVTEVSDILRKKNWSAIKYLASDANENKLKEAVQPQVLHIASHGFFGQQGNFLSSLTPIQDPLFYSGLYLSGVSNTYENYQKGVYTSPTNDGILTAYEAMNLDLNKTRLVVLSSCESGLGEIKNGEGVYGLQRAFMVAGAQNIITSFIKVEDKATSELMIAFYEKFAETNRVDLAMRYAQLKLKEKYADPKIWGAFTLTGNG